jgi:transcriptional regulator with XRE-family HTH domain
MGAEFTHYANLRKTKVACGGMALDYAVRNNAAMERKKLKAARKRLGIKQDEMAERMGVSIAQISRWESGKNGIPSQRVEAMARAYETSVGELFDEEEVFEADGLPPPNAKVLRYEGASEVVLPRDVPLYGTSLGAPTDFNGTAIEQTNLNSGEPITYLERPTILNRQKGAYGLYVQGSSMAPRHDDGATIFVQDVRFGRPPQIGDDVVVYLRDFSDEDPERASAVLVKRLVRRNSDFVELMQFTPPLSFKIEMERVVRIDRVFPWGELLS